MFNLRPPLWDNQQAMPVCHCPKCQGELYQEDKLFEFDGAMICLPCFRSELHFWLDHAPEQVADALNLSYRRASDL